MAKAHAELGDYLTYPQRALFDKLGIREQVSGQHGSA
jgi:hypothetical protein